MKTFKEIVSLSGILTVSQQPFFNLYRPFGYIKTECLCVWLKMTVEYEFGWSCNCTLPVTLLVLPNTRQLFSNGLLSGNTELEDVKAHSSYDFDEI